MESDQLRLFLAICDEGSFSAAARKLGTSQSQVSIQIKKLEDGLGTQLFDRSRRSAELTPLGVGLRPEARKIVDFVDAAKTRLLDAVAGRAGTLRVGIEDQARSELVSKRLRKFARRFRGARLEIIVLAGDAGAGCLEEDDVRILVTDKGEGREIETREIGIALPRKHRLANRERLGGEDLLGETILAASAGSATRMDELVHDLQVGDGFAFDRSRDRSLGERLWLASLGLGLTACVAEDVRGCGYRLEWCPLGPAPIPLRTAIITNPTGSAILGPAFVDAMTQGFRQ